ncbi:MAG: DUF6246 family protein [Scandinavium sp.]|uniref:DUF6246 family protein n=1 Tax=Scandinavium sp. TaxID=2830653 RepID=UPI003F36DC92
MTPLLEIGEIGLSNSAEGGRDYLLRPSFEAMNRIGSPTEIVQIYADIHGGEAQELIELCSAAPDKLSAWLTASMNRVAERLLSKAMHVLQSCCEDDLTPIIGEWKGWKHCVVYRPGLMPRADIILFAQSLMQHGVIGKAKVRRLQRHESNETTSEFRAFEYISAARSHFEMSRDEASQLTMTEFILLLSQKYPEQKGFTKDEYNAVTDDFLARQEARRAAAKRK